ncbi:MAG TPA: ribonuclease HI family protein [Candidatus Polarisedimenticolia bacterium]|nr:ribonuclease HI family protein [Candidatus Polarisedimenticolia bacterium]
MRRRPTPPPESRPLIAYIDGGARGNPGTAGFGVYVRDDAGHEVASLYGFLGHQTNNVAEYAGLLAALKYALAHGVTRLAIRSDSELLVRQIKGQYRVKNPVLQKLHRAALSLMHRVGSVSVDHVRREQNKEADLLANQAMDTRGEQPEGVAAGLLE